MKNTFIGTVRGFTATCEKYGPSIDLTITLRVKLEDSTFKELLLSLIYLIGNPLEVAYVHQLMINGSEVQVEIDPYLRSTLDVVYYAIRLCALEVKTS